MKQVRKNGAGIHISAGLSGYVAEMTSAFVCAGLGITLRGDNYDGRLSGNYDGR